MERWDERTRLLFGDEGAERLRAARVAVFGLGGVGGYAVEALARSGVGALDLVDGDKIALSNLNRQILAMHSTVGRLKTEVAAERIRDIAPDCTVRTYELFFLPENADAFDFTPFDYVIDAIDTVAGKLAIAESATRAGVPVISAMGAGNKTDPTAFSVADIFSTSVCPLARVMRRELKKRGIERLKVVYSKEEPIKPFAGGKESGAASARRTTGSTAFVPAVAGLILAGEVVKEILTKKD